MQRPGPKATSQYNAGGGVYVCVCVCVCQGLRGQRDVALSSAASWTAAGGGLGPSISHLTLNVNSQTSVGHANALPSPSGEGPSSVRVGRNTHIHTSAAVPEHAERTVASDVHRT